MQRTLVPLVNDLYVAMTDCNHILIAGSSGTGKSTLINNLIYTALQRTPTPGFILVDPKRVDLQDWEVIKPCITRVTDISNIIATLNNVVDIMEKRYRAMEAKHLKLTEENDLYVVIDEVADLILSHGKEVNPLITKIAALGRAAKIHLIMATQTVLKETCGTLIRNNFDCVVGLKTQSSNQARVIHGVGGTELLPKIGYGIIAMDAAITKYKLPKIPDDEIQAMIDFWR